MEIAIIGGGIVGLGVALNLQQRGLACRVYETVPEIKELGVGITLLPHAMHELARLGLQQILEPLGIENEESCFFNRCGQLIYREPRGHFADFITQEELRALSERYKRVAGYSIDQLGAGSPSPS